MFDYENLVCTVVYPSVIRHHPEHSINGKTRSCSSAFLKVDHISCSKNMIYFLIPIFEENPRQSLVYFLRDTHWICSSPLLRDHCHRGQPLLPTYSHLYILFSGPGSQGEGATAVLCCACEEKVSIMVNFLQSWWAVWKHVLHWFTTTSPLCISCPMHTWIMHDSWCRIYADTTYIACDCTSTAVALLHLDAPLGFTEPCVSYVRPYMGLSQDCASRI